MPGMYVDFKFDDILIFCLLIKNLADIFVHLNTATALKSNLNLFTKWIIYKAVEKFCYLDVLLLWYFYFAILELHGVSSYSRNKEWVRKILEFMMLTLICLPLGATSKLYSPCVSSVITSGSNIIPGK